MTSFDPRPVLSLPPVRISRSAHWGIAAFDIVIAIVLVNGWIRFTLSDGWTASHVAVAVLASLIVALFGLVFVGTTPQAVRVEVDDTGFRLISRASRVLKNVGWRSPSP